MNNKKWFFSLVGVAICLLLTWTLLVNSANYKLTGSIFIKNKLFDYLLHLVYLEGGHSQLILQQGLPVVRVKPNRLSAAKEDDLASMPALVCEFMTGLPPSFFQFDSDRKIKEVAGRFRNQQQPRQLDKKVRKKIKAEGTHENEEKRKVKLDFWQTDSSSNQSSTVKPKPQTELKPPTREELSDRLNSRGVLVGMYHSHTSENYGNKGYKSHAPAGQRGTIVKIGTVLANYLRKKYGINTVHSTQIHDETYARSYLESLHTSRRIVNNNPNLKMVLDIHRDAIGTADEELITTTINGKKVARIMIVVTGNDYLSNPHWRENLAFAKQLAKKMEQMYPGLLRRVEMINNRRYNLHVHPHALLLEVGGAKNTVAEAKRSARLLGNVIAEVIRSGI